MGIEPPCETFFFGCWWACLLLTVYRSVFHSAPVQATRYIAKIRAAPEHDRPWDQRYAMIASYDSVYAGVKHGQHNGFIIAQ